MKNHIWAVLWKQGKDTLKNKTILIQFIMFPFMTAVMENIVKIGDMPEHFFANLFAVMYVGMAPLTSAAAIISEEKEKNTLRVLRMCNVSATEYLIGNAVYIIIICMTGSLVIGLAGDYSGMELFYFMMIMFFGHCCSFLLGAAVGTVSKNQMMATSLGMPVMMALSFLPMLSMFNETIKKISGFVFSGQLYMLVNQGYKAGISMKTSMVLVCNVILIFTVFLAAYKKSFEKQ